MRMVACGQTMAHLPQSMQMSGSQIGISLAIARFSYRRRAGRERAVDRQRADRQQVAVAGHQQRRDLLHEVGCVVGDDRRAAPDRLVDRRQARRPAPAAASACVDRGEVPLDDRPPTPAVGLLDRLP